MADTSTQVIAYIAAFAFTNIDEFIVLVVFMVQVLMGTGLKFREIVLGTYLGFSIIMGLSLLGLVLGEFVPGNWLGLCGFLPILFGFYNLVGKLRDHFCSDEEDEDDEEDSDQMPQIIPTGGVGKPQGGVGAPSIGVSPPQDLKDSKEKPTQKSFRRTERKNTGINRTMKKLSSRLDSIRKISSDSLGDLVPTIVKHPLPQPQSPQEPQKGYQVTYHFHRTDASILDIKIGTTPEPVEKDKKNKNPSGTETNHKVKSESSRGSCACFSNLKAWVAKHQNLFVTLSIAITTIANSGDNVGVYLPLIASSTHIQVLIMVILYLVLLFLVVLLARGMTSCKFVADGVKKYGEWIMPFPLIGIGIYILSSSVVFGH